MTHLTTRTNPTSQELVGGAIIVCLAVLVWLLFVPLTTLFTSSAEPNVLRGTRRPLQRSRVRGRPIPIG